MAGPPEQKEDYKNTGQLSSVLRSWSRYLKGGSGAAAEFLVGGGREPAFRKAKKQGLVSGSSNKHEVSLIYDDKYNLKFKIGNFFRAQNKKIVRTQTKSIVQA